ncbi:glycosyltransferase family 4 protein [Salinibacter grassmerensis]|uniref:glycosyltransferase family 4 protein n=1 Tax=Salinibacter grassmerensis TaxID=3040353 RepID=UPI0021E75FDD|nr:glycosyltransferase family 1 protein [Salinibacter grassmerensis]
MPPTPDLSSSRADRPAHRSSRRIALFAGAYTHIADGVSLTLNRLVRHLEQQGAEVRVFAPTVDDPAIEDHAGTLTSVPSLPVPGRSEYRLSLGLTPSVQDALDDFAPTLYHIATPDLLGHNALQHAQDTGTPVVASYHTHFSSYLKYYHLDLLETPVWSYLRSFYNQCRQVYVPTHAMAEVLRGHGIDSDLRLWPRGVNTDRFAPGHRSGGWRRAHGIGDDEAVVAFVSRLVWEKGLDVYADVIDRLERQDVPHHSLVVGDGPAREELEARLPNTTFTGFLDGTDLAEAYASSDVFLFPSDTETFGNVTLEAMASGLPTVCADAAGSRDLVNDGTTGRLCSPGRVDAFTEAARTLIVDDVRRDRMGTAARKRAQDFTWPAVLNRMSRYYDEVLPHHPSPSPQDPAPAGAPA